MFYMYSRLKFTIYCETFRVNEHDLRSVAGQLWFETIVISAYTCLPILLFLLGQGFENGTSASHDSC